MSEQLVFELVHTWGFVLIFIFSISFSILCVKLLCGLSYRRRFSPVEKKASQDHSLNNAGFVVRNCNDCPCILKGDQCKLRGTAFCFIGQSIKKEENKNADS